MTVKELQKRFREGDSDMIFRRADWEMRQHVGALYEIETKGCYLLVISPGQCRLVGHRGKNLTGVWYQDIIRRIA